MTPQEEPQSQLPVPPSMPEFVEDDPAATAPPMSEVGRIVAVFSSPPDAFRDIARRPSWWVPVILLAVMSTIFAVAFGARVGFDRLIRQQLANSPQGATMSPAQVEQAVRVGSTIAQYTQYGGAIVSVLLGVLVIAGVFKFLFDTIMGADIGFKRLMAIVGYAQLPTLISIALSLLVLNLKAPDDFNINNPLAFNLGAFLSSETPNWLRSLGSSFDLFSFWIIALMATGISVASRKVSFGKALSVIILPWALFVFLRVGAIALRG